MVIFPQKFSSVATVILTENRRLLVLCERPLSSLLVFGGVMPKDSKAQNFSSCLSSSPWEIITFRMLVGVLSVDAVVMGPDKRYPNFDCMAVGTFPRMIWFSTRSQ